LLCVADVVEANGGPDQLQQLLPALADFRGATPNYAHLALAVLVLEGAIDLILTNWDDCVERATAQADIRIQAVVMPADLLQLEDPRVYKVHGCISRAGSLLVTTRQLNEPPTWVHHLLGARLGDSTIAFVGIGEIPDYIRVRLDQLITEIPDLSHIMIASRSISPAWDEVTEGRVSDDRKIASDAQLFLCQVLNAYVREGLVGIGRVASDPAQVERYGAVGIDFAIGAGRIAATLSELDGAAVATWLRRGGVRWPSHQRLLQAPPTQLVLCAIGVLASTRSPEIDVTEQLLSFNGPNGWRAHVEFVIANGVLVSDVITAARLRIASGLALGRYEPGVRIAVMSAGHVGPMPAADVLSDVLGTADPADVLAGPSGDWVVMLSAEAVNNGELPNWWTGA
jgi:hypothetical protein